MPLFPTRARAAAAPLPLLNSASPWASTYDDLERLWHCPDTSAVTTRTSTLAGYPDDPTLHQVAFFGPGSSINSFGFSPYPLETYLGWIRRLVKTTPRTITGEHKQVIVSIGCSTERELDEMLRRLEEFACEVGIVQLGVEFNASCPNLNGLPPPAYTPSILAAYLHLFASSPRPHLKLGIKLPPYTYEQQVVDVVRVIEEVSCDPRYRGDEVVSFLTSTNTLGQGLVVASQIVPSTTDAVAQRPKPDETFAVPSAWGGVAGEAVHQLSLGNVHRLRRLLSASSVPSVRTITLIGVGGACDRASVERFRIAGADAVGVATALGRHGIQVFSKMANGGEKL
ncbi:hypothetical protein JCM10212_005939 [Sporobolomyces blumeae]